MSLTGDRRLSLKKILEAGMRIADAAGLERLSMRALATSLGVHAMSLYNHIPNREAIIDGLVDQVVSEIRLPEMALDWKSAMRRRALSAHSVLLRHPWATLALLSRVNIGPAMLAYIEATLACLAKAGFDPEAADHIWNALDSYLYGYTLQELHFPFKAEEYREAAAVFLPSIPADHYPHFTCLGNRIIKGQYNGLHTLEFGLDLVLDGLERSVVRKKQKRRSK